MKKVISFILGALLPMVANAYDAYIKGIYYNFLGNEAEVTSIDPEGNAKAYSGIVTIPKTVTHNGTIYPVTSIGDYAFWGCSKLTSVTIPQSVIKIGNFAFNSCSGLTSVSIPKSVTSIGKSAFAICFGLKHITIPNGVTSIRESTFAACGGLAYVTIPESVTSIERMAFSACSSLKSITIPKSVTSIGEKVFSQCVDLESICVETGNSIYDSRNKCNAIIETATNTLIAGCQNTIIPLSVNSIGNAAFYGCSSYGTKIYVSQQGSRKYSYSKGLNSITIPEGVTNIGEEAFYECHTLEDITIPKSVTNIGMSAFMGCFSLKSINISNNVTSIGMYAFMGCYNLKSISVEAENTIYDSRNKCNAIIETATNTLIVGCRNTIIPNCVTSIADYAFSFCVELNSIIIPGSVTNIGSQAFIGCENLKDVYCYSTNPPTMANEAFGGSDLDIRPSITLHVPAPAVESYQTKEPWNGFQKIVPIKFNSAQGDDLSMTSKAESDGHEPIKVNSIESDSIYEIVDEIAQFSGGEIEGYKWLSEHIKYPVICQEQNIQGRVLVSLIVGKDGTVEDVKIVRSPHPALSDEAERVVKLMPKWKPAKIEGMAVRSRFIMPIMFKLKPVEEDNVETM